MDNLHNKRLDLTQLVRGSKKLSDQTETAFRKRVDRLKSETDKDRKPLGDLAGNLQKHAKLRNKHITQEKSIPKTVKPDIFPVARKPIVGAYRFSKENLQNGATETHSIKIISGNSSNFMPQPSRFESNLENFSGEFSTNKFKSDETEFMQDIDNNCFKSTQIPIKADLTESTIILSPVPIQDRNLKKICDATTQYSPIYSKSQIAFENPVNISPINPNVYTADSILILSSEEKDEPKKWNVKKPRLLFDEACDENIAFDYTDEMLAYLLTINSKYVLQRNFYRAYNPCVESRGKILNWILKMQKQLYLPTELFCLATRLFDNILAKITVPSKVYQLVGLTICWIVTKCYSCHNLSAKEILELCDNRYTRYRLVKMEMKILKVFKFSIVINAPQVFSTYYMNKLHFESKHEVRYYVSYILELFTLSVHFSTFSSSELAAGALYLALRLFYPSQKIYGKISNILGYHPLEEICDVSELMYMHLLKICDPACKVGKPFREYNSIEINYFNVLLKSVANYSRRPKFY